MIPFTRALLSILFRLILVVGWTVPAYADRDSSPTGAKVVASADGSHFMLVVPVSERMERWMWTVYAVSRDGRFAEKWSSDGYWGRVMFLSDDGESVVWLDSWPSGRIGQNAPVLATYRDSKLLAAYRAADLVRDVSDVPHSVSHYRWLAEELPPYACFDVVHFTTIDRQRYELNMRTGKATRIKD